MKKRIAMFIAIFITAVLSLSGAVVYAADVTNYTAINSSLQASCSDSIGKVYTSQIKSTVAAVSSSYNGKWKYTEVTSYDVSGRGVSDATEIDFNHNSGSTKDVTAYLSTTGANTIVAFGGIHTTQYSSSSYARTYVLVCKKNYLDDNINSWYYNSY